jgi:hypothetical protein
MINYNQLCKPMRLLPDDKVDAIVYIHVFVCSFLQNDNDISRLYSGYAPLLVRILAQSERTRWTEWDNTRLPGGHGSMPGSGAGGAGSTVLFVIGGITHAEVSAIRQALPRIALIASTSMISGDRLVRSLRSE